VDASASMALPTAAKYERTGELALALSYVALAGRHHVRMSWIREGVPSPTRWHRHRGGIRRLMEQAASVVPAGSVQLGAWMQRAASAFRMRGGQALVLSDGWYHPADWFRALSVLKQRHLEIKVIRVLTAQEMDPVRLIRGGLVVDSETGSTHALAYSPAELQGAVSAHQEQLARFCKRNGILLAQHVVEESLDEFLFQTLPARGFLE